MTAPRQTRDPGAPSSALPALTGFVFVALIAPMFYAFAAAVAMTNLHGPASDNATNDMISYGLGGSAVWLSATVFLVLYPATRGKIWALELLRVMAAAGILALAAAAIVDIAGYFIWPALRGGLASFLFWFVLAPLTVAATFLIDGLLHQPWFDPNATASQIGPSRGTAGDLNKQAGLDLAGRLPAEQLAAALAAPPPPPRWLCYAAPPVAAFRMGKWGHGAVLTPLCVAAIGLAVIIPIRAIFVYGLMGNIADRARAAAARRTRAARQQSGAPMPSRPHSRKPKASA